MQVSKLFVSQLEKGRVLAAERYDPRRQVSGDAVRISSVAETVRETVDKQKHSSERRYLILNTGDASDGFIRTAVMPIAGQEIGSIKKSFKPGDVIISRLRPYLRQVAFVDNGLAGEDDVDLVGSSEFVVLRSRDDRSVAFLVPLLLSACVQEVLSAAQEGGHHPRITEDTLRSLPIPEAVLIARDEISARIENAVHAMREGDRELHRMPSEIDSQSP